LMEMIGLMPPLERKRQSQLAAQHVLAFNNAAILVVRGFCCSPLDMPNTLYCCVCQSMTLCVYAAP
jgi:hypothetical protein